MTLRTTSLVIAMALTAGAACTQDVPALTSPKEKRSYALGVNIGTGLGKQGMDIDAALLAKGLQDALAGKKTLLTQEEVQAVLAEFQAEMQKKQAAAMQQAAETNKKAGDAFLAANKAKEGVVTLPSGLQYKVLKAGKGKKPGDDDGVTCRYRGSLLDGTEFDNSDTMGMPVTFFVKDSVIDGWKEALKLMPAGSKWQIFVPSELAFGEKGAGRDIGPNAAIIYEIELLAINPQPVSPKQKD